MESFISSTSLIAAGILLLAIVVGAFLVFKSRAQGDSTAPSTFGDDAPLDMSKFDGLVEDLMKDAPPGSGARNQSGAAQTPQAPPPPTDIMRGETERYQWSQTAQEVDVYVNLPEGTRKNQVSCTITANKLVVTLDKQPIVEGNFPASVKPDECNWQLESAEGKHKMWINLFKAKRTDRGTHWRQVLENPVHL
jgi:HSP20 family molecular chaperone IbpA